jgi:hypothetical protein
MGGLPVEAVHGIGAKTAAKLQRVGPGALEALVSGL